MEIGLGAFLIAGVLRVVVLQRCTFCINSLCHYLGAQPYSSKCSARDSWLLAILTFGEGYHNSPKRSVDSRQRSPILASPKAPPLTALASIRVSGPWQIAAIGLPERTKD
jgi:hypothetical protein